MHTQDVEQMLERCRKVSTRVQLLEEQIAMQESAMQRLTTHLSKAPGRGQPYDMADMVGRIEQLQRDLSAALTDSLLLAWVVNQLLISLPEQQDAVMRAYYILGVDTWRAVGDRLGYSESHCYAIRASAVIRMQQLLDDGTVKAPDISP